VQSVLYILESPGTLACLYQAGTLWSFVTNNDQGNEPEKHVAVAGYQTPRPRAVGPGYNREHVQLSSE
jgi:hypothetical protein